MTIDADVIVVGLGVGGEFVAGRLAEAGLDVVRESVGTVSAPCDRGLTPSRMAIPRVS